jgi:hypothetical protein
MKTDVRIVEIEPRVEQEAFRTPLVSGAGIVRTHTRLTVRARVENGLGHTADGYGSTLLGYMWAYPSDTLAPEKRDAAMRDVATAFCRKAATCRVQAHPIELFLELKPELPVIADESVTGPEELELAQRLGWSGVALKTCKGHSACLLYIAQAAQARMLYTVQDLANPGLALVHSAGLAARSFPLRGVEYGARQLVPWAAPAVQRAHQALFRVRGGRIRTESLSPVGLGYADAALGAPA